jgi:N-acetylmuramoyl-L-alanine amidase
MPQYTVKQGDCILSIAEDFGLLWETIWNHPDNAQLKQRRKDPNILFPGDLVSVPEKDLRVESAQTEKLNKFVVKTPQAQVRLRLLNFKRQPRPNLAYTATVDGVLSSGRSDGAGYITLTVAPNAREVKLDVTEGSRTDHYTLPLGAIDPIEEITGVQQRLTNLGYPCASENGTLGEQTKRAICALQVEKGMQATGELDDATRQAVLQMHGV